MSEKKTAQDDGVKDFCDAVARGDMLPEDLADYIKTKLALRTPTKAGGTDGK